MIKCGGQFYKAGNTMLDLNKWVPENELCILNGALIPHRNSIKDLQLYIMLHYKLSYTLVLHFFGVES